MPMLFAALAMGCVLASRSEALVWQILGSACGLTALAMVLGLVARRYPFVSGTAFIRGRALDLSSLARDFLPPFLVVSVAVGVMAPLLMGQMPLSHDHPVHLYKAWHFWEEMLLSGRLRGWSSFWFFGYPAEELYPIGSDLWVAIFRLGTFGLLSWEATYGLAFVGVFAFSAYAVYSFGRHHWGPAAGVVAGLLAILDIGDYREGGWSYTVDWAVWVQILAMAFFLLALKRLHTVLKHGRSRDYALAGLLFAAALLSHQMNVMLFAMSLPLLLVTRWLVSSRQLGKQIAATAAVVALGAALAGFWLLPMLGRSGWTTSIGDLFRPFSTLAGGVADGTVFANVWPLPVMLGLLGAALGIALRRSVPIFLLLLAALLIFICSSTAFEELSLMAISKSFSKIQYQRLLIPAKTCLFLLAGFAVRELTELVRTHRLLARGSTKSAKESPSAAHAWRALALVLLISLLVAPFVRPMVQHLHQRYLRTIGALVLKRSIHYWDDYQAFLRWSAQQRQQGNHFYRISYELDRHNHLMMGAPAFNNTPYYKVGYTPAKLFKHVTETTEDPLYRALSVKYIVSLGPLSRPQLEEAARFGSIWVYRFKDYRPQRYTLSGSGEVEVVEFSEERIRLKLSKVGSGSRLKVHVANYPRWRARLNGQTVPISEAPAYGSTYPMLMEVAAADGELIFQYVYQGMDWLGLLASLAGLGVTVLLLALPGRARLRQRLRARLGRVGRLSSRYAGWAALALVLAAASLLGARLLQGKDGGMAEDSISRMLPGAKVSLGDQACTEYSKTPAGKGWYCSPKRWNYLGPTIDKFNGGYIPCIWAHPVDGKALKVVFPGVLLGRAISGNHGLTDGAVDGHPGGAPVSLEIAINGEVVKRLSRPQQKGWVGFRLDTPRWEGKKASLSLSITTERAGGRHYCFDARIVR